MSEPYYTIDNLEPGKSIGFLMKRCGVLMTRVAERRFGTEPVSFMQWFVLANLGRYERMSPTILSGETGCDMGALTRIVDVLENGGLLRRQRSKRDRRTVEIALTSDGRRRLQSGKRVLVELLNELVDPYTRLELETLIGLLQRMLLKLQESVGHEDAPPGPKPGSRRNPPNGRPLPGSAS